MICNKRGNFVSKLVSRILVTTDSSYFSAEDCKVKEMVDTEVKKCSGLNCS